MSTSLARSRPPAAHGFSFVGARKDQRRRWAALFGVLIAAGVLAMGVAMLFQLHRTAAATTTNDARSALTLLRSEMNRNIDNVDLSIQAVADNVALPEFERLSDATKRALLFDRALRAHDIGTVILFDRDGKARFSSDDAVRPGDDFSDRVYFSHFVGRAADTPFVTGPNFSRVDHQWSVSLSRRVADAAGGFAGAVMAPIHVGYFDKLLRAAAGEQGDRVWLVTGEGLIVSESAPAGTAPGALFPGWFQIKPQLDGAGDPSRIVALPLETGQGLFAKVGDWPLYLAFVPSEAMARERWARSLALGAVIASLAAVALALSGMLRKELTRSRTALAEVAALNAELERLSTADALTGLAHRRRFNDVLALEAAKASRYGRPLALALIDVDLFTRFNDRYGQSAGDLCLTQIAAALRDGVRSSGDLVCRYGGDEFALILTETDEAGAGNLCERLRRKIRALDLAHADASDGCVTVSAGVAGVGPGGRVDAGALLRLADAALSRSKDRGRDRVGLSGG